MRFERYQDALDHAQWKANESRFDIAIRRVKEFGRDGYNVGFAAGMDSDYAKAEIVRPETAATGRGASEQGAATT